MKMSQRAVVAMTTETTVAVVVVMKVEEMDDPDVSAGNWGLPLRTGVDRSITCRITAITAIVPVVITSTQILDSKEDPAVGEFLGAILSSRFKVAVSGGGTNGAGKGVCRSGDGRG